MLVTYVLIYILLGILSVIVYYFHRNLNYWKDRGIPCEQPHPIYGNVRGFRTTRNVHSAIFEHYDKFRNSAAPFVGFYFMQKPAAFIMDTKLAKHILIKDFSNFADRGLFYNEIDDPLSAHLFNLDGSMWKQLRAKLSPTFTSGKMKYMFPTIVKVCNEFEGVFKELVPSDRSAVVEIKDLMARFTTDVIGTCAFGIECNSLRDPNTEFLRMGRKPFTELRHNQWIIAFMIAFPKLARKLHMRRISQEVHDFYMGLTHETVALREKEKIKRNDFMDILIDLKNNKTVKSDNGEELSGLTMNEVAAQAFVFFAAGFDTSSSTMGFALYELAKNQEVQDKLRADIQEVLALHNQQFTYECVKDFRYLDQVISETLRLYTIVPHLDRRALRDYVVPGHPKLVIEAGTAVMIPACAYHRDPELYPEPLKFQPERFSPEMVKARDSVEWLPFGDGPRNCIGMRFGQMQTRVGLAQLIKNFKFSVCEQTETSLKYDPKSFLMGIIGGIHLRVERV